MVKINEQHTIDYFAASNGVAISPEEAFIAVEDLREDLQALRIETQLNVEECVELLVSQPSSWPTLM